MGRTRDTSKIFTSLQTIDVSSSLDTRIFVSSASPTSGNTDGRIWIDTSTASAPVIQVFGSSSFRSPRTNKSKAIGGVITESGPYTIHTFLSTDTFIPLNPPPAPAPAITKVSIILDPLPTTKFEVEVNV